MAREFGAPGDSNEPGRWSLDHLFLDQDGIPTFVECRRAEDTRIRREVPHTQLAVPLPRHWLGVNQCDTTFIQRGIECHGVSAEGGIAVSYWPRRDSNPHGPFGPQDFKSRASANSATRPKCSQINRLAVISQRSESPVNLPVSRDGATAKTPE